MNDVWLTRRAPTDAGSRRFRTPLWAVVAGLTIWAVAVGYALLKPPEYQAKATFAIIQDQTFANPAAGVGAGGLSAALGITSDADASLADLALGSIMSDRMLMQFVESEELLPLLFSNDYDATAEEWLPGLSRPYNVLDGAEALRRRLDLSSDPQYALLHITLRGRDRVRTAEWLNAYLEMVDRILRMDEQKRVEQTIQFAEAELLRRTDRNTRLRLIEVLARALAQQALLAGKDGFIIRMVDPAVAPNPEDMAFSRPLIMLAGFIAGLVAPLILWLLLHGAKFRIDE